MGDEPEMTPSRALPQWLGIWRPPEQGSAARANTPSRTSSAVMPRASITPVSR